MPERWHPWLPLACLGPVAAFALTGVGTALVAFWGADERGLRGAGAVLSSWAAFPRGYTLVVLVVGALAAAGLVAALVAALRPGRGGPGRRRRAAASRPALVPQA